MPVLGFACFEMGPATGGFPVQCEGVGFGTNYQNFLIVSATQFRTGAYSLKCTNGGSTIGFKVIENSDNDIPASGVTSDYDAGYMTFGVFIDSATIGSPNKIASIGANEGSGTIYITINSSMVLSLVGKAGVVIAVGTTPLALGRWYLIQLKVVKTNGAYGLWIDGNEELTGIDAANIDPLSTIRSCHIHCLTTGVVYYDDIVWDTERVHDNPVGWILPPVSDYSDDAWTKTGAATGWECTNSIPPDHDTTYISAITAPLKQSMNLKNPVTAGITGTIHGVRYSVLKRKSSAATSTVGLKMHAFSGATDQGPVTEWTSAAAAPTYYDVLTRFYESDFGAGSVPWSMAALANLHIGIECSTASGTTPTIRCTSVFVFVLTSDYGDPTNLVSGNVLIANKIINNTSHGVQARSTENLTDQGKAGAMAILGNVISGNGGSGVFFAPAAASDLAAGSDSTLAGNVVSDNVADGIRLEGAGAAHVTEYVQYTSLVGNVCVDEQVTPTQDHGIELNGRVRYCEVVGNIAHDNVTSQIDNAATVPTDNDVSHNVEV